MPRTSYMRYMTWEVAAAAFVEHDRSSLSPVDVADELAVQLTHRGYFDGRRRFSLGVRALAEGAASLAEEPEDHIAQMNYMQCGGSAERMTIEVRVASGEGMTHYAVSRMPVADDNAWIELPYDGDRSVRLHPEEVFSGEQAVPVFRAYILDGALPPEDLLRDLHLS